MHRPRRFLPGMIAALVLGPGLATEEQRQQEHERRLRELEGKGATRQLLLKVAETGGLSFFDVVQAFHDAVFSGPDLHKEIAQTGSACRVLPPTPDPPREPRSSEHRNEQKKARKSKAAKKKRRGY